MIHCDKCNKILNYNHMTNEGLYCDNCKIFIPVIMLTKEKLKEYYEVMTSFCDEYCIEVKCNEDFSDSCKIIREVKNILGE